MTVPPCREPTEAIDSKEIPSERLIRPMPTQAVAFTRDHTVPPGSLEKRVPHGVSAQRAGCPMLLRAFVQQKRLGCGGLLVLPPIEKEHALDRRSVGADDGLNVIESPAGVLFSTGRQVTVHGPT